MANLNSPPTDAIASLPLSSTTLPLDCEKTPSNSHGNPATDDLLVEFSVPDAHNPKDWRPSRKWVVTCVLSVTGFNRIMVSTMMAPALPLLMQQFDMSSAEANMALSIYLLATAFGPLFLGPLSEMYGRAPILYVSSIWFLIWNMACGFATGGKLLIASRFLAGFGASAMYILSGGVLGDMYRPEERGKTLGIYLMIPLLGSAVGPIVGGYLTESISWRWMFWITSIAQAVLVVVSLLVYRETYGPVILARRAKLLHKNTGLHYHTAASIRPEGTSLIQHLGRSMTRPIRLMIFHPIIQINMALQAFNYGLLYIILATFSSVYIDLYHQSTTTSGLHYLAIALGELFGSQIAGWIMDWSYSKLQTYYSRNGIPEFRIPMIFPFALLTPVGILLYGWAVHYRLHWAVVDAGIFIYAITSQAAGQAGQAYTIDAYVEHVGSAQAATQFWSSLAAFAFPLFVPSMYRDLGYGWGNSTLATIYLVIGVPSPLILWRWGPKLRAKAGSTF